MSPKKKNPPTINKETFLTLGNKLDHITEAIDGNGKEGLKVRMARIEEKMIAAAKMDEESAELQKETADKLTGLVITMTKMEAGVNAHHASVHLSGMIKKKSFWFAVVGGLLVCQTLVSYFPLAWNSLVVFFGLPGLILPSP